MTKEEAKKMGATHYKESRAFVGELIYFKETQKGFQQYASAMGWLRPSQKPIKGLKPL